MEYEILWNGSHKDTYLCVRDPERLKVPERPVAPMRTLYVSRAELRENLLMLLAERPRWTISELREQLRVDSAVLGGVIQRAIRAGEIARVAYGCVRLVYRRDNKRAVA